MNDFTEGPKYLSTGIVVWEDAAAQSILSAVGQLNNLQQQGIQKKGNA